MSAPRKSWDDHSDRWKRDQTRKGLSRSKWDSWFKLSPKSRKITNPYEYAKGRSVAEQRLTSARKAAFDNMVKQVNGRIGTIRVGVEMMTAEQLRWTAKANAQQIRRRAGMKMANGKYNPWWYN